MQCFIGTIEIVLVVRPHELGLEKSNLNLEIKLYANTIFPDSSTAERSTVNRDVVGSSPALGAKTTKAV